MDEVFMQRNSTVTFRSENRRLRKEIKQLEDKTKNTKSTFWRILKVFIFILTVTVSVCCYFNRDDVSLLEKKARFYEISKQLRANVFHQYEAVELILKNLSKMKDEEWRAELFVMPFIGTSGVSKTYIANIIKKNYSPAYAHDVSKYDLENNFEQTYFKLLVTLQDCCNLIFMDDLSPTDVDLATRFITALPKHKIALVIPIVNIQDIAVRNKQLYYSVNDKCIEDILDKFTLSGLHFEHVLFRVMSKNQLETAIIQLMIRRGVDYAKCGHLVKEIAYNHDVVALGFKQLHNKLNVIWDCGVQNGYRYNKNGQAEY